MAQGDNPPTTRQPSTYRIADQPQRFSLAKLGWPLTASLLLGGMIGMAISPITEKPPGANETAQWRRILAIREAIQDGEITATSNPEFDVNKDDEIDQDDILVALESLANVSGSQPGDRSEQIDWRLELADDLLEGGDYDEAREQFDEIRYRRGLAAEGSNEFREAAEIYSNLIAANAGQNLQRVAAAQLGLARINYIRGATSQARSYAWEVLLRSAKLDDGDDTVAAEAHYLLALMTSRTGLQSDDVAQDPGSPVPVSATDAWRPDFTLSLLGDDWTEANRTSDDIISIVNTGPLPLAFSRVAVDVSEPTSFRELFDKVVTDAEHPQPNWSTAAAERVRDKKISINVDDMPLAILLTGMLDKVDSGLVWTKSGSDQINVGTRADRWADTASHEEHVRGVAYNLLETALSDHKDHRWAARARVELGSLALLEGNLEYAGSLYEQAWDPSSTTPLNIVASYNRALLLSHQARVAEWLRYDAERKSDPAQAQHQRVEAQRLRMEAREGYGLVAHGAMGHPLQAMAAYQLGRLYLDSGEFKQAVYPLKLAVESPVHASGDDRNARRAATVHLALAQMLVRGPIETLDALRAMGDRHTTMGTSQFNDFSLFLEEYARYELAATDEDRGRRAERLFRSIAALIAEPSGRSAANNDTGGNIVPQHLLLGPAGNLAIGRACRDLQFWKAMNSQFGIAQSQTSASPILREIQYTTTDWEYDFGELSLSEAMGQFEKLALDSSDRWAKLATLRKAEIDLANGNAKQCAEDCAHLLWHAGLGDLESEKRAAALLGRAYEEQKEYDLAKLCYRGKLKELQAKLKERDMSPNSSRVVPAPTIDSSGG